MREIKFRAWDYKNDKMRDWEDVSSSWAFHILNDQDKQAWMQFTGLHDKNGREIYEGDILEGAENAVRWDEQAAHYDFGLLVGQLSAMKVIGNIYENAEPLTK